MRAVAVSLLATLHSLDARGAVRPLPCHVRAVNVYWTEGVVAYLLLHFPATLHFTTYT